MWGKGLGSGCCVGKRSGVVVVWGKGLGSGCCVGKGLGSGCVGERSG